MTVPTNNEEREALIDAIAHGLINAQYPDIAWSLINGRARDLRLRQAAAVLDVIEGAGFRRPPVSGDNTLRDELLRRTYLDAAVIETKKANVGAHNLDSRMREIDRAGLRAVANLAASQPREVEAAPSDIDWRARGKAVGEALEADWVEHVSNCTEQKPNRDDFENGWHAGFSRTSHPVQVEVTDDMVERAAEGIARERLARHVESLDDYWAGRPDAKRLDIDACKPSARAALVAALGGGNWPAHDFIGVAGHPDDDECTFRADGTDATYCGETESAHAALGGGDHAE